MARRITPAEAAAVLDVSKDTICRWLDQGLLTGWRLPTGGRRVDIASVRRVAAQGIVPPRPQSGDDMAVAGGAGAR